MKLLFDENLSHKLVELVQSLFPDSAHVTTIGFGKGTPDREIWDYAKDHGFTIVTGDRDFLVLSARLGPPPKVIILENCDYPTHLAARLLSDNAVRISELFRSDLPLLVLRKP
jgi:predicted nuclease of predicted toxin-antitoxin system